MSERTHIRLSPFERSVVAALLILLVAAALPSAVQMRRAPRENEFRAQRGAFAEAVGALHGRWLLQGSKAGQLEEHGLRIALNRQGWPTLDARHPTQDTALELYHIVMRRQLPRPWTAETIPARDAGVASFALQGPGGGSFRYDAATGAVE